MRPTPVPSAFYVCGRCLTALDRDFSLGTTTIAGVCSRCGGQAVWVIDAAVDQPRLAHRGLSAKFSTDHALLPWPTMVWDVNGYYAALGLNPTASKAEIREAYQALDGHEDERLTYIVKQLLDPEVRGRYDGCQVGELFFDKYLEEVVLDRIKDEAARLQAMGLADGDDLEAIDLSDALNTAIDLEGTSGQGLDKEGVRRQYDRPTGGPWGFYLWRSSHQDPRPLARWRALLAASLWGKGEVKELGVGYCGSEPWAVLPVDGVTVVFIHESTEPTPEAAEAAAETIIQGA